MPAGREKRVGLRVGLSVLGSSVLIVLMALGFAARSPALIADTPSKQAQPQLEALMSDRATTQYLRSLDRNAPIAAQMLRLEASRAIEGGASEADLAHLVLRSLLAQLKTNALDLRNAHVSDYDAIVLHVGAGLEHLKQSQSPWCQAVEVETLLKREPTDMVTALLSEFPYKSAAYDWALEWGELILTAANRARRDPVPHGRLTRLDKAALQQKGMEVGASQWALALQIANFSQAEGQGYREMREVIEAIDVCRLGITAADLSARIPSSHRGRIWADLLPEIFYGNTPYVIARVTDYFFIT